MLGTEVCFTLRGGDNADLMSLAVGSDEPLTLYAGTTGGVFRGVRESAGQAIGWTHLSSGLPADIAVTKVLWANSRLFAGTALHGLWQYDGTTWAWVQEMQSMAGHTISTIGQIPATSLDFTAAASAKCEVYLFPFQLTERQTIQVCAKPDTEVKLLSLGPRVAPVAASTQSEPGFYAVVLRAADPLASDVAIKVSVKQPN